MQAWLLGSLLAGIKELIIKTKEAFDILTKSYISRKKLLSRKVILLFRQENRSSLKNTLHILKELKPAQDCENLKNASHRISTSAELMRKVLAEYD